MQNDETHDSDVKVVLAMSKSDAQALLRAIASGSLIEFGVTAASIVDTAPNYGRTWQDTVDTVKRKSDRSK